MTHEDYIKQAKELGAVSMRVFRIQKFEWGIGHIWISFSYHFFNGYDVEICYYIQDLMNVVPMFIFKVPREWSEEFKNNPAYELVDLKLV